MANFFDYLKWRGDLTFSQDGLNEADCLILAYFSYVNLAGIVPTDDEEDETGEGITVRQAAAKFVKLRKQRKETAPEEFVQEPEMFLDAARIFVAAAKTRRFENCRMCLYVSHLNYEQEKQFRAVCIRIDDETTFVSYSGTDETILGWKEDFNMAFLEEVPSQAEAVSYLGRAAKLGGAKLITGGHSKGGNLAIYAPVKAGNEIRERVIGIYNYDGPGFSRQFVETEEYQQLHDRIHSYVPEESVVGMLLEHGADYKVVKNQKRGIMAQHLGTSWEILGPGFVEVPETDRASRVMDITIREWLEGLSPKERQEFIDVIYGILEEANVHSVSDLSGSTVKLTASLTKEYSHLSDDQKTMVRRILGELIRIGNSTYRETVWKVRSKEHLNRLAAKLPSISKKDSEAPVKDANEQGQNP